MRKIGYIRVSTREQSIDRQLAALANICDDLLIERVSAICAKRPIYTKALRMLRAGDTLVILDLDRAYRSTVDAIIEMEKLKARGIFLRIVNLSIDTSTPWGLFTYTIVAACAALERQMLSQRTKEGLAAARRRGKKLGRPRKLSDAQLAEARTQLRMPDQTLKAVAADYDVAPWTLTRSLRQEKPAPRGKRSDNDLYVAECRVRAADRLTVSACRGWLINRGESNELGGPKFFCHPDCPTKNYACPVCSRRQDSQE